MLYVPDESQPSPISATPSSHLEPHGDQQQQDSPASAGAGQTETEPAPTHGIPQFSAFAFPPAPARPGQLILNKFVLYETKTRYYILGTNAPAANQFRVLKIDRTTSPDELAIEEDMAIYSKSEIDDLLVMLRAVNKPSGGMRETAKFYGIVGFIRFTEGYYISLITKRSPVALIGGHYVFHIDSTSLVSIHLSTTPTSKLDKNSDEARYLQTFQTVDLSKNFYFSYSYDITRTLQWNMTRQRSQGRNRMFVWNEYLLEEPFAKFGGIESQWALPIMYGFVDQSKISILGRNVFVTLIARRSRYFAGARFLKRGVNDQGHVANDVETEQIVSEMSTTSFHGPDIGSVNPNHTSFVQHRGSIPLFWAQDGTNMSPKPPIELNVVDPFFTAAARHFDDMFHRYGAPCIVLNLIKAKEKTARESILLSEFIECTDYLNQFLPNDKKIEHIRWDMSRASKSQNENVISVLEIIAEKTFERTGFFHSGFNSTRAAQLAAQEELDKIGSGASPSMTTFGQVPTGSTQTSDERRQEKLRMMYGNGTGLQDGVVRTNCIDCLDRTNAAQFVIAKNALGHQLYSLGLISEPVVPFDCDVVNMLTEMYHDHGDTIALQYGGSHLVNTMETYRKINQWTSHSRDMIESIRRFYSNSFVDAEKQDAMNLFLGNFIVYKQFGQGQQTSPEMPIRHGSFLHYQQHQQNQLLQEGQGNGLDSQQHRRLPLQDQSTVSPTMSSNSSSIQSSQQLQLQSRHSDHHHHHHHRHHHSSALTPPVKDISKRTPLWELPGDYHLHNSVKVTTDPAMLYKERKSYIRWWSAEALLPQEEQIRNCILQEWERFREEQLYLREIHAQHLHHPHRHHLSRYPNLPIEGRGNGESQENAEWDQHEVLMEQQSQLPLLTEEGRLRRQQQMMQTTGRFSSAYSFLSLNPYEDEYLENVHDRRMSLKESKMSSMRSTATSVTAGGDESASLRSLGSIQEPSSFQSYPQPQRLSQRTQSRSSSYRQTPTKQVGQQPRRNKKSTTRSSFSRLSHLADSPESEKIGQSTDVKENDGTKQTSGSASEGQRPNVKDGHTAPSSTHSNSGSISSYASSADDSDESDEEDGQSGSDEDHCESDEQGSNDDGDNKRTPEMYEADEAAINQSEDDQDEPEQIPLEDQLLAEFHYGARDNFWEEYYRPKVQTSFQRLFAYNMNSTTRYIPATIKEQAAELSPFEVRQQGSVSTHQLHQQSHANGQTTGDHAGSGAKSKVGKGAVLGGGPPVGPQTPVKEPMSMRSWLTLGSSSKSSNSSSAASPTAVGIGSRSIMPNSRPGSILDEKTGSLNEKNGAGPVGVNDLAKNNAWFTMDGHEERLAKARAEAAASLSNNGHHSLETKIKLAPHVPRTIEEDLRLTKNVAMNYGWFLNSDGTMNRESHRRQARDSTVSTIGAAVIGPGATGATVAASSTSGSNTATGGGVMAIGTAAGLTDDGGHTPYHQPQRHILEDLTARSLKPEVTIQESKEYKRYTQQFKSISFTSVPTKPSTLYGIQSLPLLPPLTAQEREAEQREREWRYGSSTSLHHHHSNQQQPQDRPKLGSRMTSSAQAAAVAVAVAEEEYTRLTQGGERERVPGLATPGNSATDLLSPQVRQSPLPLQQQHGQSVAHQQGVNGNGSMHSVSDSSQRQGITGTATRADYTQSLASAMSTSQYQNSANAHHQSQQQPPQPHHHTTNAHQQQPPIPQPSHPLQYAPSSNTTTTLFLKPPTSNDMLLYEAHVELPKQTLYNSGHTSLNPYWGTSQGTKARYMAYQGWVQYGTLTSGNRWWQKNLQQRGEAEGTSGGGVSVVVTAAAGAATANGANGSSTTGAGGGGGGVDKASGMMQSAGVGNGTGRGHAEKAVAA